MPVVSFESPMNESVVKSAGDVARLEDLTVKEVSLVDLAAIKRKFLIVKRDGTAGPADQNTQDLHVSLSITDVASASSPELIDSLTKVMKGLEEADVEAAAPAIAFLSKIVNGGVKLVPPPEAQELDISINTDIAKSDTVDLSNVGSAVVSALQAAEAEKNLKETENMTTEKIETTVVKTAAEASANTAAPAIVESAAVVVEKQKGLTLEDGQMPSINVDDSGKVTLTSQPIEKGQRFTAARTEAIKSMANQLASLLKEVDPTAHAAFVKSQLPEDTTIPQQVVPVGTAGGMPMAQGPMYMRDANAEVPAWATELQKSLSGLTEKVTTIEKARSPSTAATEGGTDDPSKKAVEKSKSLFGGLLFGSR